ncbi:MAG: cobalamin-dependent protein [Thermodesulfobacteriota bacterium]
MTDNMLQKLEDCVADRNTAAMQEIVSGMDRLPAEPAEVLEALCRGMERARAGFAEKTYAIPDLLLSVDCFRMGADWVFRLAPQKAGTPKATVVIGVVAGDVHHMGKNLVAAILSANGYQVHDAGRDVANSVFLDLVRKNTPDILALSVMMSTPQANMAELIRMVRLISPETSIIVGGASMDAQLARSIGADGYALNAGFVPEEFARVLSLRSESRKTA